VDKATELKIEDAEIRLEVKNNELKRVRLRMKQITYDYEQQIEQQKGNENNILAMISKLQEELSELKGNEP
jgi:hypothetical protein